MASSAEDFNFHAEKKHRDLRLVYAGKTDGVFFRSDQGVERTTVAPFHETEDFFFGEAMMVGESFGHIDNSP